MRPREASLPISPFQTNNSFFRFPFDHQRFPLYPVIYAVFCVSLYFMALTVVAIDSFFMSVCIHLRASLNDLNATINSWDAGERVNLKNRIIKSVKYHNEIDDRIKALTTISSPIVLAQFFISLVELCTLAFDVIMVGVLLFPSHFELIQRRMYLIEE